MATIDLNTLFPARKVLLDRIVAAQGHCPSTHDGYQCSLPKGHELNAEQEHIAYGNTMMVCARWPLAMSMPQGGDEHVIISADRPVEYGTLDGNTIKVRS